jgi:hypothetical protein
MKATKVRLLGDKAYGFQRLETDDDVYGAEHAGENSSASTTAPKIAVRTNRATR